MFAMKIMPMLDKDVYVYKRDINMYTGCLFKNFIRRFLETWKFMTNFLKHTTRTIVDNC